MKRLLTVCMLVVLANALCLAAPKQAKNPDLTSGEKPGELKSYGMGPTGFVGWTFNNGRDSDESRQILVTMVEAKSPADGILEKGDVILGAAEPGGSRQGR